VSGDILDAIDGALDDYATSKDAMRWVPPEDQPEPLVPTAMIPASINVDLSGFIRGMQQLSEAMGSIVRDIAETMQPAGKFAWRLGHAIDADERPRWHKRRCRECNPRGNPLPLAVNGHEYARRRKARGKRNRGR
jgi:hypothetical protein